MEGHGPSVAYRAEAIRALVDPVAPADIVDETASRALWRGVADLAPFVPLAHHAIWRLSVVPSEAPAILAAIGRRLSFEYLLDWGGAAIWCAVASGPDCRSQIGSGALPVDTIESAGLVVRPAGRGGEDALGRLAAALRALPRPVIGRVTEGALVLDLRCLEDEAGFIATLQDLSRSLHALP